MPSGIFVSLRMTLDPAETPFAKTPFSWLLNFFQTFLGPQAGRPFLSTFLAQRARETPVACGAGSPTLGVPELRTRRPTYRWYQKDYESNSEAIHLG